MEVHAHTHTARKKWIHYFWEFLMLFLAVFCGFLAENIREHKIEQHRAKEFSRSLVEDLQNDTAAINSQKVSAVLYHEHRDRVRQPETRRCGRVPLSDQGVGVRSEEHTSELQSQ